MVLLCKTITDYPDATGVLPMLYSIRDCVPSAYPGLVMVLFFVLFAGNYFINKGKTGRARVMIALAASSFVTIILTMFLTLSQLVTYKILLLWTFIGIISFIGLIISDRQ